MLPVIKRVNVEPTTARRDRRYSEEDEYFLPSDLTKFHFCEKCKEVKPPRAHHCSVCQQCVLRMDHHCPWVGNCVGLRNHKYFLNFLFYVFIALLQVFSSIFFFDREPDETINAFLHRVERDPMLMLSLVISFSMGISVLGLFVTHTYLLLTNKTTIEISTLRF